MGLLNPCLHSESIAKNIFRRDRFYGYEVEFCRFLDALGFVFLIFVGLETGLKLMGFRWCNGSKAGRVAVVNHAEFWTCKLTADGCTAESRTDDC